MLRISQYVSSIKVIQNMYNTKSKKMKTNSLLMIRATPSWITFLGRGGGYVYIPLEHWTSNIHMRHQIHVKISHHVQFTSLLSPEKNNLHKKNSNHKLIYVSVFVVYMHAQRVQTIPYRTDHRLKHSADQDQCTPYKRNEDTDWRLYLSPIVHCSYFFTSALSQGHGWTASVVTLMSQQSSKYHRISLVNRRNMSILRASVNECATFFNVQYERNIFVSI